jgi:glucose/arabinose dehydrogenase
MLGSLLTAVTPSQAATVPTGFTDSLVAAVPNPTAVQGTADGRILVASKQGLLRVIKNGVLLAAPAINLNAKICWNQERGLLGIAVDPNPATKAIYLFYTLKGSATTCPFGTPEPVGAPRNRVSRFILKDDSTIDPASETVLLDGIMSAYGGHNAGDLQVGKDGYLYVSTGDGGCDYLGDSTVPGGSGCGGDNDASRDRNILNGKILRITTSGAIPADNPFQGSGTVRCSGTGIGRAGSTCQEIYAVGLRNPFRMAFDPNAAATRFFINDVGQNVWEEIDLGTKGADYGWNIREGHCQQTGLESDCGTATPAGFTNPYYDYGHSTGCGSITGGAFVPNGIWPAAYTGAYLYGDYVCGNIYALSPSKARTTLATGLGVGSAVAMAFGADAGTQSLYYVTYNNGGQLHKIRYTGAANRAPSAALTATPMAGKTPLTVRFDGSASIDPDGNALSYQWAFGDGSPSQTSSVPTVSHVYTATGNVTATLTVRDPAGLSNSASVVVHAGNTAPVPTITTPAATQLFSVGGQYTLTGSATDSEDGALPASALRWTVIKHHATHTHPFLGPVPGNNIPLTGPIPEDLAAAANSFLEIQLTVTDSGGASTTVSRNFNPQKVPVTIATAPAGRSVTVNGGSIVGPTTVTSWRGFGLQVNAQTQTDAAGATYGFDSWSDGGTASHVFTTPATAATLTATLSRRPLPTPPTRIWIGQTGAGQATIAWSPPTDTGGSPITGYRVSRDGTDSGGTGPFSKTVTAATRFSSLTNLLTGGSNYQFSVQAITANGTGPAAAATVAIAPLGDEPANRPGRGQRRRRRQHRHDQLAATGRHRGPAGHRLPGVPRRHGHR